MSNTDEKAAMASSQPRLIFNEALCSILKKEQKFAFNEMGPPIFHWTWERKKEDIRIFFAEVYAKLLQL